MFYSFFSVRVLDALPSKAIKDKGGGGEGGPDSYLKL